MNRLAVCFKFSAISTEFLRLTLTGHCQICLPAISSLGANFTQGLGLGC
jgi:hypothetical protein